MHVGIVIIISEICWALVVSEATAIGYSIHAVRDTLLKLAGQELIDNVYSDSMVTYPSNLTDPFEYIRLNGICQESPDSFPYDGEKGVSRKKTEQEVSFIINSFIFITILILIFINVNK